MVGSDWQNPLAAFLTALAVMVAWVLGVAVFFALTGAGIYLGFKWIGWVFGIHGP